MSSEKTGQILNAFCIDLEEWFHVCEASTPYDDPKTWDSAASHVVKDTEVILRLLDEAKAHATFLTVGWVAERHPELIRRLNDAGHEVGCHTHFHRLVYTLTPEEFAQDLKRSLEVLRQVSGQTVISFRAPGFSMKRECFWAYPILRENGITVDVSVVPAPRDHGGIDGFSRDPILLHTDAGALTVFPLSVLSALGRRVPFSGGGYLRLFSMPIIKYGFRQNHRAGRPVMTYIHPREIDPQQPRLELPRLKGFKYYVNIASTEEKLRTLLKTYRFGTVTDTLAGVQSLPDYQLVDGDIVPMGVRVPPGTGRLAQPAI
ncbi:MAG: polysaccharide deacetylase family protein [Candidatus Korobacteraceae bacterium]|jgi:polysaccharide deacetylase family protein (PEP-CTERM system associated)